MMNRLLMAASIAITALVVNAPSVCAQQYRVVRAQLGPPGAPAQPANYSIRELIDLSLARNPALQQAGLNIQAAQGKAVQAGLYPNPTLGVSGDELGDRTGPGGIWTAQVGQEIVLGGKLKLSRAVAQKEVDQATLALQSQRYALFTTIRQGYFDVLTAQRRVELLDELVKLAQKGLSSAEALQKGKQIAELDVLPFRVELDRLVADFEASQRELIAARRRLAASVGSPDLPIEQVLGSLELPLPSYKYEEIHYLVMEAHPDVRFAVTGIDKADLALRRAQVEKIPNVTIGSGYTRQNQNKSSDWLIGVSVPVPVFNRNQGNVQAAGAELGRARNEVSRVQNELAGKLATAHGQFTAAKQRADRYRTSLLPNAAKSYELSLLAFKGGQFEYIRVIQAQRTVAEARLEYIRVLGDAWRAASEIAGLTLEDDWPFAGK